MRTTLFSFLVLFSFCTAFTQDNGGASIRWDTIYSGNTKYAYIAGEIGMLTTNLQVYSMDGTMQINVERGNIVDYNFIYNFPNLDGKRACVSHKFSKEDLASFIVTHELFKGKNLDFSQARRFISNFNCPNQNLPWEEEGYVPPENQTNKGGNSGRSNAGSKNNSGNNTGAAHALVDREITAPISIENGKVMQDGKEIARVDDCRKWIGGEYKHVVTLSFVDGTRCARLDMSNDKPNSATIVTQKDNKSRELEVNPNTPVISCIKYLVDLLYL